MLLVACGQGRQVMKVQSHPTSLDVTLLVEILGVDGTGSRWKACSLAINLFAIQHLLRYEPKVMLQMQRTYCAAAH